MSNCEGIKAPALTKINGLFYIEVWILKVVVSTRSAVIHTLAN